MNLIVFDLEWNIGYQPKTFLYHGTELTLRGVSGALDWSALGSLPLQTVTTDAMQADAVRASGTTAVVTVTD